MMRVKKAFESHKDLYDYLKQCHPRALEVKEAVGNPYGDIYTPKTIGLQNSLDPEMYKRPHSYHSHGSKEGEAGDWHKDIKTGPLLLGDPENTFVWTQPDIKVNTSIHRSPYSVLLTDVEQPENRAFYNLLENAE